jgi:hypothetical protein
MNRTCSKLGIIFGVLVMLALVAPAHAANAGPPGSALDLAAPDAFGGNNQWTVIQACEFDEETLTTPATGNVIGTGYVHPVQPFSSWWTQVELPAGAEVLQVILIAYDFNATENVFLDFYAFESALAGTLPFMTGWGPIQTTGQPAYTTVTLDLMATPVLIRTWQDLDVNGIPNWVSYHISIWTGNASDASVRFFGAAVEWRRIISPAPGSATFPDVSASFWAFQEIEALAASGITTGFPDGTFRPTAPVTRAQMAAFLARALGLHWPN